MIGGFRLWWRVCFRRRSAGESSRVDYAVVVEFGGQPLRLYIIVRKPFITPLSSPWPCSSSTGRTVPVNERGRTRRVSVR